jgi:hypothetical protein
VSGNGKAPDAIDAAIAAAAAPKPVTMREIPVTISSTGRPAIVIAFIKQAGWSAGANAGIAFAVYIAVGVAGALATEGRPTWESIVPWVTTVTLVGRVAYEMFWSKIAGPLNDARITAATSIVKAPAASFEADPGGG